MCNFKSKISAHFSGIYIQSFKLLLLTIKSSSRQISTTMCTNITGLIERVEESCFNPNLIGSASALRPSLTLGKRSLRSDESRPHSWRPGCNGCTSPVGHTEHEQEVPPRRLHFPGLPTSLRWNTIRVSLWRALLRCNLIF